MAAFAKSAGEGSKDGRKFSPRTVTRVTPPVLLSGLRHFRLITLLRLGGRPPWESAIYPMIR
jgi:hypothetical protein